MTFISFLFAITVFSYSSDDPLRINLWEKGPPDAQGTEEADQAYLLAYLPDADKATGAGIVVCPGGGYGNLAMNHEGEDVAAWLNSIGVAAFVLKYRHAPGYKHPTPLRDAQRAIRLVRAHAKEWSVETGKVGILGFSAGGHLAASTGIHFDWQDDLASDTIDKLSARPDFMVLAYPVISMSEAYMHRGSRNNLLGKQASDEMAMMMSHEKQVSSQTPPTFLFHTTADKAVPPENSIYFYLALREAGIDAEMHIYEEGRHGLGLAPENPALNTWPQMVENWLRARKVIH